MERLHFQKGACFSVSLLSSQSNAVKLAPDAPIAAPTKTLGFCYRARKICTYRRRAGRREHSRVPIQHHGVCFAPLYRAAHWPRHQLQCSKQPVAWPKQHSQSAEHDSGDDASMAAEPLVFGPEISIRMLRCRLSPMDAFQACAGDHSVYSRPTGPPRGHGVRSSTNG
jgi:hypothetical protein